MRGKATAAPPKRAPKKTAEGAAPKPGSAKVAPAPRRGRGRPKGSIAETKKDKITLTLDSELIEWARAQGNASATVAMALRLLRNQLSK